MAAVVGYILDAPFSEPAITSLAVTAEGFVVAKPARGRAEFLGSEADLDRNLMALIDAAGLDADEVTEFGRLQRERT